MNSNWFQISPFKIKLYLYDKVALWNSPEYRSRWIKGIEATLSSTNASLGTCVDLSDGPLLSIIAARSGAPSVLCLENDHDKAILSRGLAHASGVSSVVRTAALEDEESEDEEAEPVHSRFTHVFARLKP